MILTFQRPGCLVVFPVRLFVHLAALVHLAQNRLSGRPLRIIESIPAAEVTNIPIPGTKGVFDQRLHDPPAVNLSPLSFSLLAFSLLVLTLLPLWLAIATASVTAVSEEPHPALVTKGRLVALLPSPLFPLASHFFTSAVPFCVLRLVAGTALFDLLGR